MTNLELMRKRLEWQGGVQQENRMIKDKWRTLQRALKYSYQACTIAKVQSYAEVLDVSLPDPEMFVSSYPDYRALINPDKVKQDYDDKILSIDYAYDIGPGDVFEWRKTGTQWIIYTQEITEDAYFRGEIRRCRYRIKFKDAAGNWCATWAAIRGPVETAIDSIQKNQVRIDRPNLSLNILMPQNSKTLEAFERYQEFLFAGRAWKVEAHDSISMKNILEISAQEDYINIHTDDTDNEMKNGLVIEEVDPTPQSQIQGETFIKPMIPEVYKVDMPGGTWSAANYPVTLSPFDDSSVELTWCKSTSGQFDLLYSIDGGEPLVKTIVVESLF